MSGYDLNLILGLPYKRAAKLNTVRKSATGFSESITYSPYSIDPCKITMEAVRTDVRTDTQITLRAFPSASFRVSVLYRHGLDTTRSNMSADTGSRVVGVVSRAECTYTYRRLPGYARSCVLNRD